VRVRRNSRMFALKLRSLDVTAPQGEGVIALRLDVVPAQTGTRAAPDQPLHDDSPLPVKLRRRLLPGEGGRK